MADQIIHDEQAFRQHVFTALGEIKEKTSAVVDRLDKLNGSVARHQGEIVELKQAEAVRKAVEGEREKQEEAREKQAGKWWDAIKPFVYGLVLALLTLLAMNGPALLKSGGLGGGH